MTRIRAVAVTAVLALAAPAVMAQLPTVGQAICFNDGTYSTYDVEGDVKAEGGTLLFKSQINLIVRLSGACLLRTVGVVYDVVPNDPVVVQCYGVGEPGPFYSAEVYTVYASDGVMYWIEVLTGDRIIATASLRCEVYDQIEGE